MFEIYCLFISILLLLLVLTVNSLIRFDLTVLEQTDRQTDTHVVRTDAPEMIPYQNLLMVDQIVVIASVAASAT